MSFLWQGSTHSDPQEIKSIPLQKITPAKFLSEPELCAIRCAGIRPKPTAPTASSDLTFSGSISSESFATAGGGTELDPDKWSSESIRVFCDLVKDNNDENGFVAQYKGTQRLAVSHLWFLHSQ